MCRISYIKGENIITNIESKKEISRNVVGIIIKYFRNK